MSSKTSPVSGFIVTQTSHAQTLDEKGRALIEWLAHQFPQAVSTQRTVIFTSGALAPVPLVRTQRHRADLPVMAPLGLQREEDEWDAKESVMRHLKPAQKNILKFLAQHPKEITAEIQAFELDDLQTHIERLQKDKKYPLNGIVRKQTKVTELENALRTLNIDQNQRTSIRKNTYLSLGEDKSIGCGELCARVWRWIKAQPLKTQFLYTQTLLRNLAECIEDDNNRVCNQGTAVRIIETIFPHTPKKGPKDIKEFWELSAHRFSKSIENYLEGEKESLKLLIEDVLNEAGEKYNATEQKKLRRFIAEFLKGFEIESAGLFDVEKP